MLSARKIVVEPIENQEGGENDGQLTLPVESKVHDKIKHKIYDKLHRFLKIILKIASKSGYDDNLEIQRSDGTYMPRSNIVDLLTHAMSPGKILHGEREFVELLYNCSVDPDLLLNENVRSKLLQYKNSKFNKYPTEKAPNREEPSISKKPVYEIIDKNNKKRIVEVKDGDTITLDEPQQITDKNNSMSRKRKHEVSDIEDDDIDPTRWKTN